MFLIQLQSSNHATSLDKENYATLQSMKSGASRHPGPCGARQGRHSRPYLKRPLNELRRIIGVRRGQRVIVSVRYRALLATSGTDAITRAVPRERSFQLVSQSGASSEIETNSDQAAHYFGLNETLKD